MGLKVYQDIKSGGSTSSELSNMTPYKYSHIKANLPLSNNAQCSYI